MIHRLALGTAQFGGAYGINGTGEVSDAEMRDILKLARAGGISVCDTAALYGHSEARLGAASLSGWRVVTKLPGLPTDVTDVNRWVRATIEASLNRLRVSSVWGVLVHRSADLHGPHGKAFY